MMSSENIFLTWWDSNPIMCGDVTRISFLLRFLQGPRMPQRVLRKSEIDQLSKAGAKTNLDPQRATERPTAIE
jgi:hypothetical protein